MFISYSYIIVYYTITQRTIILIHSNMNYYDILYSNTTLNIPA